MGAVADYLLGGDSVVKRQSLPSLTFQALVYEHPGQELEIELFDEDPDKDDFLGR